jgi:hypothetical protein
MYDNIEDLPIRPAFGSLRGVRKGVTLNAKQTSRKEWLSTPPPEALAHVHRPARISNIWEQVLTLLRNPIETHHLSGGLDVFNLLGVAIIVRSTSGCLTPYLWCQQAIDKPYIDRIRASTVILQDMPSQWIWLDRLLGFAKQEYGTELDLLRTEVTPEELAGYFQWVNRLFRKQIRQHADMGQVRRRIATALALDPTALRRARCGVPRGRILHLATVQDYNDALLMASELDPLAVDAPHLLPLYMALGQHIEFPNDGEPVQRLKTFLLRKGFKECHWRYIAHCNRRLVQPMRHVYIADDVPSETLDYLRIVCSLGLRQQLPEPLANTLFAVWGHAADRSSSYWRLASVHQSYPHIMKLAVARFGTLDFDVLQEELLAIIRWAWDIKLKLTTDQRREGWVWLLRQARAHIQMLDAKQQGENVRWQVPAKVHTAGAYQLRFLASSYDLWEEAKTMRHCADTYVERCQTSTARLASVSSNQRRVATAMFAWTGDKLVLTQISGIANRPVGTALSTALEILHIEGAKAHFDNLAQEVRSGELFAVEAPVDIAWLVEQRVRPQGKATLPLPIESKRNHMTALLTFTGDFIREAEITPVHAIADTFQIEFKSRLLTAKNPKASQKNFAMSLDRDGLLELKALIERSLA